MESTLLYLSLMFVPMLSIIVNRPEITRDFIYACVLSSFMGFLLRIAKRFDKAEKMNIRTVVIQFIFSACVCYFSFLMLLNYNFRDFISYIILGCSSFLSAEIVASFEIYGKSGIRLFIKNMIRRWIAMDDKDSAEEDKKKNEENIEKP